MDEPFSRRVEAAPAPLLRKGEKTREAILADSLALASQIGLESLSISTVTRRAGLSKSGLFGHFASKEDLQLAILQRAQGLFRERVLRPAQAHPPGMQRLRAFLDYWLVWLEGSADMPGGCMLFNAATEYDGRPGPMRDLIAEGHRGLRGAMAKIVRLAIEQGELSPDADPWQFTFELFGIALAASHERRLLDDPRALDRARQAFERLITTWRPHRP
jgi:AcrR family transcriptional regulator